MNNNREFQESPFAQGVDESIAYTLTVPSSWGSSPTSPSVVIKDPDGVDVSATCLSGSASVLGSVITTPKVKSLIAGNVYRLEVKWTDSGNTLEAYGFIVAQI